MMAKAKDSISIKTVYRLDTGMQDPKEEASTKGGANGATVPENKTKRFQLVMRPSLFAILLEFAHDNYMSINEAVNSILEERLNATGTHTGEEDRKTGTIDLSTFDLDSYPEDLTPPEQTVYDRLLDIEDSTEVLSDFIDSVVFSFEKRVTGGVKLPRPIPQGEVINHLKMMQVVADRAHALSLEAQQEFSPLKRELHRLKAINEELEE